MVETFHLLSKSMENKIFETSEISLHQKIYKIYLHFESSISLYSYLQNSTKLYILPTIHNFFTLRSFFDPKTEKMKFQLVFSFQRQGAFRTITLFHHMNKPFRNKKDIKLENISIFQVSGLVGCADLLACNLTLMSFLAYFR